MKLTGLVTLVALMLLGLVSAQAQASLTAFGPVDAGNHFPSYFQDRNGLRLEPCLDGPPLCFAAASDLTPPEGEAFYNNATATQNTRAGGKATLVLALEAAYAADGSGQEITFSRVRFTDNGGLLPGRTYKVTHPFGVDSFVANPAGAIPANVGTEDIGALGPCLGPNAHAAGGACDFGAALAGQMGPFLQWAPNPANAADKPPVGYVGDGVTPHAITGSPNNTNVFRIEGPSVNPTPTVDRCPTVSGANSDCVETTLFSVEGKIAGPLLSTPSKLSFGSQQLGTASAAQSVSVKNISASSLSVTGVALDTASGNPEDFTVSPGTCATATLARDASCSVSVQFTPTATSALGTRTATLLINHNGIRTPERIALRGSAAAVGTAPAVSLDPASGALSYADQRLGTQSAAQTVTIKNTGDADLNISKLALGGADAIDFSTQDTCVDTVLAPTATCTINVVFAPQVTAGAKTATLTITDDATGSPRTINLTGTATAGLVSMGPIDGSTKFPYSYTDANGVSLQLCLDGPPNCLTARSDLVAPGGEAFYNNATAKLNTRAGGKAVLVLSLEAAYAGPGANQQITFSRIRFSDSGGLLPNAVYTVTHPFGVDEYTANSQGQVVRNVGTQDIGSLGPCNTATAHLTGGVCDFAGAMTGRFGPFLRWAPNPANALDVPPAGFVGDAATDHKITGSPLDTNVFRIQGPGINPTPLVDKCPTVDGAFADCVETDLFTVAGKLA